MVWWKKIKNKTFLRFQKRRWECVKTWKNWGQWGGRTEGEGNRGLGGEDNWIRLHKIDIRWWRRF
jgi:hypothetical protein